MNMIFTYNAAFDADLKSLTRLSNKFSNSESDISFQNMVTVLGHPNKMIFNIENCMTPISIFHKTSFVRISNNKLGVINLSA